MALINIGGDPDDPSYRYKMPRLTTKIEGRGNGIKTVITNASDVAQALGRPPALITKFFGNELGAQSKYDATNDKSVVNGSHNATELQEMLKGFIDKFVLCQACGNPETGLVVRKKDKAILQKCISCGAKAPVPDQANKLCAFILKDALGGAQTSKKDRRAKKKERRNKKEEDMDDEEKRRRREERRRRKKDREAAAASTSETAVTTGVVGAFPSVSNGTDGEEENVQWHTDTSAEAVRRRQEEEAKRIQHLSPKAATFEDGLADAMATVSVEDSSALDAAVERLKGYLATAQVERSEIAAETRKIATNSALRAADAPVIYFFAAIAPDALKAIAEPNNLAVMQDLVEGAGAGTRAQMKVLTAVTRLVSVDNPALLVATPVILKQLYENDVVEEDAIIEWYNDNTMDKGLGIDESEGSAVREKAQIMVEWLEEDEEEEEESDD